MCPPAGQTGHMDGSWQGPHTNARGEPTDPNKCFRQLGGPHRTPTTLMLTHGNSTGGPGEAPRHASSSRALTLDTQAARRASAAARSSSCRACSSPATSSSSSAPRSGILGRNAGHEDSGGQAPRTVSCRERGPSESGRQHRCQLPSLRDGGTGGMPTPGHTASCMATITQAGLGAREAQKPVFWKAEDP